MIWLEQYRWWIVAAVALGMVTAGWLIVSNLMDYEKSKARSEEIEKQAVLLTKQLADTQKKFEEYITESQRQIQAMAAQQAALAQSMVVRAQAYQGQVQSVQKATSTEDIIKQLKDYLQVTATSPAPGMVSLPADKAQTLVLIDLENKKLRADIDDLKSQFELEKQKSQSLQAQLDKSLSQIQENIQLIDRWEKVSQSWKVTAKKGKWKRVLDFAKPMVFSVAAGVIAGKVIK